MPNKENVSIVLGETADEIEKFAAAELQKYLRILFGLDADITTGKSRIPGSSSDVIFLAGTREHHSAMIETRCGTLPSLTDQGFLLRKIRPHGQNGMVLLGGSPRAVLWAVYDLVARWGVRYLLMRMPFLKDRGIFIYRTSILFRSLASPSGNGASSMTSLAAPNPGAWNITAPSSTNSPN